MNKATLRNLAIGKVLGPSLADTQGLDVNEAFVDALINEALHKVERAALWRFSEGETEIVLLAGEDEAPVPEGLAVPLMARNESTGQALLFHDERQEFLPSGPARLGQVEVYSVYADTIRFKPAPQYATTITLRYYKTWPDLVADDDEPAFPATWHDILSDYAASKLVLRLPTQGGKYLPSSAAQPYEEAWRTGLLKMMESPLTLATLDSVEAHHLAQSVYLGEGSDW
jgi:hypothetical protein